MTMRHDVVDYDNDDDDEDADADEAGGCTRPSSGVARPWCRWRPSPCFDNNNNVIIKNNKL